MAQRTIVISKTSIKRRDPKTKKPKIIPPWGVELTFVNPPVFKPVREDEIDISNIRDGGVVVTTREHWHPSATLKEEDCTVETRSGIMIDRGRKKFDITKLTDDDVDLKEGELTRSAFRRGILDPLRARRIFEPRLEKELREAEAELRHLESQEDPDGKLRFRIEALEKDVLELRKNGFISQVKSRGQTPFSDNEDGDIGTISWGLRSIEDLEKKIEHIVKCMIARIWVDRDGIETPTHLQDLEHHKLLNLVCDESPKYIRESDYVMTAGRMLSQPKRTYRGSLYRALSHEREISIIATAILRADGLEAYPTKLFLPKPYQLLMEAVSRGLPPEAVPNPIGYGVSVFPDEQTMKILYFDETFPNLESMIFYTDHAIASMLFLSHGENMVRREFKKINEAQKNGTLDSEHVEHVLQAIRKRAEAAAKYWELNPEVNELYAGLDIKRVEIEFNIMMGEIKKAGIKKRILSKGMKPEEVVDRMKRIITLFDPVSKKYGGVGCAPVLVLGNLLYDTIDKTLRENGLPDENVESLKAFLNASG